VLGVKPNAKLYVSYPQPAVSYNTLAGSYSGNLTVALGPNAGMMGTATISSIRYLNSNSVLAQLQVVLGATTYQSSMIMSVDDFGLLYEIYVKFSQFSSPGEGLGILIPPGVPVTGGIGPGDIVGFFADLGNGDFAAFTLSPH